MASQNVLYRKKWLARIIRRVIFLYAGSLSWKRSDKVAEDAIHRPAGMCRRAAGGWMFAGAAQMLAHLAHMVQLDVFRVGDGQFLRAAGVAQQQRFIAEHGKADLAFAADDIDMIDTLKTAEIPTAAAGHAGSMQPAGAHRIFG